MRPKTPLQPQQPHPWSWPTAAAVPHPRRRSSPPVKENVIVHSLCSVLTMWCVLSFVMFCFVFCWKFWLPIGLHRSCSISPTVGEPCQKCSTKYHDRGDATQCIIRAFNNLPCFFQVAVPDRPDGVLRGGRADGLGRRGVAPAAVGRRRPRGKVGAHSSRRAGKVPGEG